MNENLTELVFIIDRSGSMAALTEDTIGGFNSMLERQREGEGKVLVSTILFNQDTTVLHDRLDLADVPEMTRKDYCAAGCTALIDAIGGSIRHIANIHKYARLEDVPAKTLFIITTDGLENASRHFSAAEVREKIRHEQEKYGWEFIFLGANIDSVETAERYGIDASRAVNYHNDGMGTAAKFAAMDCAVRRVRRRETLDSTEWRAAADNDYNSRNH